MPSERWKVHLELHKAGVFRVYFDKKRTTYLTVKWVSTHHTSSVIVSANRQKERKVLFTEPPVGDCIYFQLDFIKRDNNMSVTAKDIVSGKKATITFKIEKMDFELTDSYITYIYKTKLT